MKPPGWFGPLLLTLLASASAGALAWSLRPHFAGVRSGRMDEGYVESRNCTACHPGHFASWAATHHSRMTQAASDESVLGDFERNNTIEFLGIRAQMQRQGGRYSMTLTLPGGGQQNFPIERTVGSRRIQQYVTNLDGQRSRLPLAYDLVNRRWMSLNGSFFHADNDNFFQFQSNWDGNCVFCHNVKAQPNRNPQTHQFATEVAELGIACGACHGPGAQHVDAAAAPWTRAAWRINDVADRHIVQPTKLSSERAMMVCGHCHGQRVPEPIDRIQQFLTRGDPYNAGDDLAQYFRPVTRATKVGDYSFANRFWNNGSPRLTAFEYQGILRSKCYSAGRPGARIQCLSCHSMHSGDPNGQITAENRTNRPCLACHQELRDQAKLSAHTQHRADGVGSRCYNCHMPRVIYGIMSFHPSHDISTPDPRLTITQAVPNACNQCHFDQSVNWALREVRRLWPARFTDGVPATDEQFAQPEGLRELFAGDALTRALAADALGGGGPMPIAAQSQPLNSTLDSVSAPDARSILPYLIEACADDYPIVRYFALRGIAALEPRLGKPDYLAPIAARPQIRQQLWQGYLALHPETTPAERTQVEAVVQRLRAQRVNVDVDVGE